MNLTAKNKKKSLGFTLIEIMIGVVISTIMMAAMYTSYNVVNSSYSKVTDKAKISRAGRDIITMMMRDIRLAGFKYYYGENNLGISTRDNLDYWSGANDIEDTHAPIVIIKNKKGFTSGILVDGEQACFKLDLDFDEVYKRTNTSYKPDSLGRSDYKSASSVERIEAFLKLGRKDPVTYIDGWETAKKHVEKLLKNLMLIILLNNV